MKNYLLTVAFANQAVLEDSYSQLRITMETDPLPVILFDNCYPLNFPGFGMDLAVRYGFQYYTHQENIGLYKAWEYLLSKIPADCEKVILYDGDNYPVQQDWHLALLKVLDDPEVVHATLYNEVIEREISERGAVHEVIQGIRCATVSQAMTNTVCAFKVSFLRETGGIIGGHKYYGGNEIAMWPFYKGRKWVFLEEFREIKTEMMAMHDWQYQQYKLLYAHKGLNMSFDEYLWSDPTRIYDLEKQIFG